MKHQAVGAQCLSSESHQETSWEDHPLKAIGHREVELWLRKSLSQKLLEAGSTSSAITVFICPDFICPWPLLLATVGNEASSDLVRQMLRTCTYSEVVIDALRVAQSSISICRYRAFLPWQYGEQQGCGLRWCDLLMQSKMVILPGYSSKEKIIDLAFSGIPATVIMMMMVTVTRQKGQQ